LGRADAVVAVATTKTAATARVTILQIGALMLLEISSS
jgi:hypothetical protein